jgi:hypothetical protein
VHVDLEIQSTENGRLTRQAWLQSSRLACESDKDTNEPGLKESRGLVHKACGEAVVQAEAVGARAQGDDHDNRVCFVRRLFCGATSMQQRLSATKRCYMCGI